MKKTSFYNFVLEYKDNYLLLYNTRTGAFIAVNPEHKDIVKQILNEPNSFPNSEETEILSENGFLVEENFNEFEDIKNTFIQFRNNGDFISYTILPTENCNFKCPYCFIYDRRGLIMQDAVFDAIYKNIEKSLKPNLNLFINWFGGEPTLAKNKVVSFMLRVRQLLNKFPDIQFGSSIITNGFLLNYHTFKTLFDCGITRFQVTLDGNEKSHNTTRALKDGSKTFSTIIKNLLEIKKSSNPNDSFTFYIRVNFLKDQESELNTLSDELSNLFGHDPRFFIYYRAIYDIDTCRDDIRKINDKIYSPIKGLQKQSELFLKSAYKVGNLDQSQQVIALVPDPIPVWCLAQKEKSYIIGADGTIFKCDSYIGNTDKAFGKLTYTGEIEKKEKSDEEWDESIYDNPDFYICMKCKFLPICQGGCPRGRKERIKNRLCFYSENIISQGMINSHIYYKTQGE